MGGIMKKRFFDKVFLCAVFLTLMISAMCFSSFAEDSTPSMIEADAVAPISAVYDSANEYGIRIGTDIGIYEDDEAYYLFLPSSADISDVKLRYDGDKKLYDQNDGSLYSNGDVVSYDCSSGNIDIFEYDSEKNVYYRYPLVVMQGENIASIYITLDNGDDGLKHINSSHDAVEKGQMLMTESNGKTVYSGDLKKMKGHGLTSYVATGSLNTKNSYNINLSNKAELIEGAGKSKKWCLLKIRTYDNYDATGVSYPMGFYIFDALAGKDYFNITSRYVNVYINGEYRGVYILTERMDMKGSIQITNLDDSNTTTDPNGNTDSYTKVDKSAKDDPAIQAGIEYYSYGSNADSETGTDISGGYVLEIMCGQIGESGFKTKKGMYINVKSPSYPTKAEVQYIAEYVQNFENALFSETGYNSLGKHYSEYIDIPSYAMQALTYSFCLNWEIYRTSTYMYKDVDGSEYEKITFGPVWDFETGPSVLENDKTLFGTTFSYTERQQYIWYEQFWKKADFMTYTSGLNNEMKKVIEILVGESDGNRIFSLSAMLDNIRSSQNMNWIRWSQSGTFDKAARKMTDAVDVRYRCWYNRIWNEKTYLLGASVTSEKASDGYLLTANVVGKAESYQWYRLDENDPSKGEKISGATDSTYTATDDGVYYCAVTGKNNAYWEWASGNVFSKENITMYTDPIKASGEKNDGITVLNTYELGEEPKTVQGLTTASEYVYIEPQTEEISDTATEEEKVLTVTAEDKPYIIASAIVSLASVAVVCICLINGKKGGRKNA